MEEKYIVFYEHSYTGENYKKSFNSFDKAKEYCEKVKSSQCCTTIAKVLVENVRLEEHKYYK